MAKARSTAPVGRTKEREGSRDSRARLERVAWAEASELVKRNFEHFDRACEACELTPPQAALLRELEPGRDYPMNAMACALSCHASNVTGIVDRLEERGLLERRASLEDRRVKHLAMTEAGIALRARLLELIGEAPPVFRALDERELATLTELLARLRPPR